MPNDCNILSTTKIDHIILLLRVLLNERLHDMLDGMHTQPVSPVDERCSPLKLLYKKSKKLRFIWEIELFHAALGHNATIVCLL